MPGQVDTAIECGGVGDRNDTEREKKADFAEFTLHAEQPLATFVLTISQWGSHLALILPSRGQLLCLDTFLVVAAGLGVLLACGGERPEMLLSVLRCTGHPPHKEATRSQMSPVLTWRNPAMNLKNGGFLSCLIYA